MDLIDELGHLALASRLRRLAERLQQEVSQVYAERDLGFRARWFAVLTALGRESPQPVSGLAAALGLTHTGVAQIAAEMQRAGLVRSSGDPGDGRRRLVHLTAEGEATAGRLAPLWRGIRAATAELVAESGHDLLAAVAAVEARLAARPMDVRLRERLAAAEAAGAAAAGVEVVGWRPELGPAFRSLNLAWLEPLFGVEEADRRLLDDPQGEVVDRGGEVLFALAGGEPVGTCALVRHGEVAELAKMAVAEARRGAGIGRRLVEAAIERAREAGFRGLFLLTSPRLEAAVALYRAVGFRPLAAPPVPYHGYSRCSIVMGYELAADAAGGPSPRVPAEPAPVESSAAIAAESVAER